MKVLKNSHHFGEEVEEYDEDVLGELLHSRECLLYESKVKIIGRQLNLRFIPAYLEDITTDDIDEADPDAGFLVT